MEKMILGKTGLEVTRTGFGALPVQRVNMMEAEKILFKAYEGGINFFDTANAYSDSEEKIGQALSRVRQNIIIATKSGGKTKQEVLEHLKLSLKRMKTDYVDILQLHNPSELPDPTDRESIYGALLEAREQGLIRYIGMTNHRLDKAVEAVKSGYYDTVQFPLSAVSSVEDLKIIELCRENEVGLIAMKALSGGLITNARMAFAFLRQFENVVPIWGIQKQEELEEILALDAEPPVLDTEMLALIEREKDVLKGDFCRGCGYCLPCPAEIEINNAARMAFLLRRAPYQPFITPEWQEKMKKIDNCIECNKCSKRCPYNLDTPALLKKMRKDYWEFVERIGD